MFPSRSLVKYNSHDGNRRMNKVRKFIDFRMLRCFDLDYHSTLVCAAVCDGGKFHKFIHFSFHSILFFLIGHTLISLVNVLTRRLSLSAGCLFIARHSTTIFPRKPPRFRSCCYLCVLWCRWVEHESTAKLMIWDIIGRPRYGGEVLVFFISLCAACILCWWLNI